MYSKLELPNTIEEELKFIDNVSDIINNLETRKILSSLYYLDAKIIGTYGYHSEYRNIGVDIASIKMFDSIVKSSKERIYNNLTHIVRTPNLVNHIQLFDISNRNVDRYLEQYNRGIDKYNKLWDNRLQFLKDYLKLPSYYEQGTELYEVELVRKEDKVNYIKYSFNYDFSLETYPYHVDINNIPKWAGFVVEFLKDKHPNLLL
jgi:hypothetical protein